MRLIPLVVVVFVLLWGAVAVRSQDAGSILYLTSRSEITSLDPAVATGHESFVAIENLFLGLTDLDPFTNEIMPELATHWEVSDYGLRWTFYLRDDVMWRHYNRSIGMTQNVRTVNAADFVYSIKRACHPRLESPFQPTIVAVIEGCQDLLTLHAEIVDDNMVFGDTVKVFAHDETTLEIRLREPVAYFLAMTTMPILRPVPREAIEAHGDEWTSLNNIVTNGPYMLEEYTVGVQRVFVRNDAFPEDLRHGGNIDLVVVKFDDSWERFSLYSQDKVYRITIPGNETGAETQIPADSVLVSQMHDAVFYFGFLMSQPPFDNVHVRRAFSAIIDRQAFIEQIRQRRGIPMIHFTPPGMSNSPLIDSVGVGFDPTYAQHELALAGYPNCEGFPMVQINTYTGAGAWAEFWAAAAEEFLGCDPRQFSITQLEFRKLIKIIESDGQRPNAWTLGWGSDFPDAHSFLFTVLSCQNDNPFGRECNAVDDLMLQAGMETDVEARAEMYQDVEVAFFGEEGEFPIAPIFVRTSHILTKKWFAGPHEIDGTFGGEHWDAYSIAESHQAQSPFATD